MVPEVPTVSAATSFLFRDAGEDVGGEMEQLERLEHLEPATAWIPEVANEDKRINS